MFPRQRDLVEIRVQAVVPVLHTRIDAAERAGRHDTLVVDGVGQDGYATDAGTRGRIGAGALPRQTRLLEVLLLARLVIVGIQIVERQQVRVVGFPLQRAADPQAALAVLEV